MRFKADTGEIKESLNSMIESKTKKLEALKSIEIKTNHKKLTNATIVAPDGIHCMLMQNSYSDDRADKTLRYYADKNWHEIRANVFTGETDGIWKLRRLMTPMEMQAEIERVIRGVESEIESISVELGKVDGLVDAHNELLDKIDSFNGQIVWVQELRFNT